jgi:hypothetical protein
MKHVYFLVCGLGVGWLGYALTMSMGIGILAGFDTVAGFVALEYLLKENKK